MENPHLKRSAPEPSVRRIFHSGLQPDRISRRITCFIGSCNQNRNIARRKGAGAACAYITPAAVPRIPRPAIHKARHILFPEIFIVISVPPPGGGTNNPPAYHRKACDTAEINSLKEIINIPLLLHGPHNDSRNQIFLQKRINQQERNHRHHDLGRIQVSVG